LTHHIVNRYSDDVVAISSALHSVFPRGVVDLFLRIIWGYCHVGFFCRL